MTGSRRLPSILWGVLAGIAFFAVHPVGADEIRFRSGAVVRDGTVLEETEGTVTIRFPREAIESISPEAGMPPAGRQGKGADSALEQRVRQLERTVESLSSASADPDSGSRGGTVEGAIRWKNLPLAYSRVLILPRNVAGRPPATAAANGADAGSPGPEGSFETRTDGAGRYRFERVPPGEYLLYWMPDPGGGWVRRLRESADLVVSAGRATVLNIPEERR